MSQSKIPIAHQGALTRVVIHGWTFYPATKFNHYFYSKPESGLRFGLCGCMVTYDKLAVEKQDAKYCPLCTKIKPYFERVHHVNY